MCQTFRSFNGLFFSLSCYYLFHFCVFQFQILLQLKDNFSITQIIEIIYGKPKPKSVILEIKFAWLVLYKSTKSQTGRCYPLALSLTLINRRMKNKLMTGLALSGILIMTTMLNTAIAQRTDEVQSADSSESTSSPKVLPKYAAVNGYHAGNYKQHAKASMIPLKTDLIATEASDKKVVTNYKMPHDKKEVKKVSTANSGKKVPRSYKMPYN